WTNLTLLSGWTVYPTTRGVYRKVLGHVYIEATLQNGAYIDGSVITTLPLGYRPSFAVVCVVAGAAGANAISPRVTVNPDGTIKTAGFISGATISMLFNFSLQ
ncbi:phage tail protein, partial [Yersinia enterocolitica]